MCGRKSAQKWSFFWTIQGKRRVQETCFSRKRINYKIKLLPEHLSSIKARRESNSPSFSSLFRALMSTKFINSEFRNYAY
jgi:hypothetical protein